MTYVKQQCKTDCGIACLAMLIDITYDEAKALLFKKSKKKYITKTKDLLKAIEAEDSHIVEGKRLSPVRKKSWVDLPANSLVKVFPDNKISYKWHWVVWSGKKIYDPSRGVFRPQQDKFKADPVSYLEVKRF